MKNCINCYEDFAPREGYPNLDVCEQCEPDAQHLSESRCPNCGWDSNSCTQDESDPATYSGFQTDWEYGYLGLGSWVETWTCAECKTVFTVRNSSI